MPDWIIPVVLTFIGTSGFSAALAYYVQKRNIDMKARAEEQTSIVSNTEQIRELYAKTMKDMEDKHTRDELEWEKERARMKKDGEIKDALLDQMRQQYGELLVKVDSMERAVNKVGDDVNRATGDFGKFPLAGDRGSEPFGRRATDKPKGE